MEVYLNLRLGRKPYRSEYNKKKMEALSLWRIRFTEEENLFEMEDQISNAANGRDKDDFKII
jgi:hypothetical protein